MDLVAWELCGSKWDSGKHLHVQVSTSHEHIFMVSFNAALPLFHLNFSVLNAWDANHCVDNFMVITPPMLANFACGVQHTAKSLIMLTLPKFTADVSTGGVDRKFLFWDVSKEFPISLSVLHRFT
jgi:hypothetical protein